MEYKGEIDSNRIIVGNLDTSLSIMDRTSKQKISKETQDLNNIIDQMDLTDIYRTFDPTAAEYTFRCTLHLKELKKRRTN